MKATLEHVSAHAEWWGPDEEWTFVVTLHHTDGQYTVLPPVPVGPFEVLSDILEHVVLEWQQRLL